MARGSAARAATLLGGSEAIFAVDPVRAHGAVTGRPRAVDPGRAHALGRCRLSSRVREPGSDMTRDEVVDYVVGCPATRPPAARPPVTDGPLSRRELEVAGLVADGATNAQVAARLFISERTVESHMASIFNKLGVDTRLQVARWFASTQVTAG